MSDYDGIQSLNIHFILGSQQIKRERKYVSDKHFMFY